MTREVIEVTPLVTKQSVNLPDHLVYRTLKNLSLIALWYFFSTTLSLLNKHLIGRGGVEGKGKFPAPLLMTGVQFFVQFVLCRLFLDLGLVDRTEPQEETKSWTHYFKNVVPNGVSTGLDIGFSNLSLRTISLSFYTMCKSTTPLFLLLFAFVWRLESPSWSLSGIMLVISSGVLLLVYGETKFNFIGFSLVMTASCLAGLRWTLTQVFLQGNNTSRQRCGESGALELLEKLTPIMSGIVLFVSVCFERWHRLSQSPYFESSEQTLSTFGIIVALGVIAFLMVWTEFKVIKETSALTFMVAGTFKEVVTVVAAVALFGDEFGWINGLGLFVLLVGVSLFNAYKYQKIKQQQSNPKNTDQLHRDSESQPVELKELKSDLER